MRKLTKGQRSLLDSAIAELKTAQRRYEVSMMGLTNVTGLIYDVLNKEMEASGLDSNSDLGRAVRAFEKVSEWETTEAWSGTEDFMGWNAQVAENLPREF
jgi:hypothetical protein